MKSNTARTYELKNGFFSHAKLFHLTDGTEFVYGVVSDRADKSQVAHGWQGQNATTEIATCDYLDIHVGDKIVFATGRVAIVNSWTYEIIDKSQLQFVSYEKADKVMHITIQNLGA